MDHPLAANVVASSAPSISAVRAPDRGLVLLGRPRFAPGGRLGLRFAGHGRASAPSLGRDTVTINSLAELVFKLLARRFCIQVLLAGSPAAAGLCSSCVARDRSGNP